MLEAVSAAERAFPLWRDTPAMERAAIMKRAAALLRERAAEVAAILTLEMGKPIAEAETELRSSADILDWFAEEARRVYGRVIPPRSPDVMQLALKQPVGPVAAFTPWNFPVSQLVRKVGPALAAGCTVVAKPPEDAPASPGGYRRSVVRGRAAGRGVEPALRKSARHFEFPDPASRHSQGVVYRLGPGRQATCLSCGTAYEAHHDGAGRSQSGSGL